MFARSSLLETHIFPSEREKDPSVRRRIRRHRVARQFAVRSSITHRRSGARFAVRQKFFLPSSVAFVRAYSCYFVLSSISRTLSNSSRARLDRNSASKGGSLGMGQHSLCFRVKPAMTQNSPWSTEKESTENLFQCCIRSTFSQHFYLLQLLTKSMLTIILSHDA